jgi:hypothetical protein
MEEDSMRVVGGNCPFQSPSRPGERAWWDVVRTGKEKEVYSLPCRHDNNKSHREAISVCCSLAKQTGRVDEGLFKQLRNEQEYWRNVLKGVVSVVKFSSERGLPFRGQNEEIGSVNNGNFLETIKLLAKYDASLGDHLNKFGNAECGVPSYFSSTICNELKS